MPITTRVGSTGPSYPLRDRAHQGPNLKQKLTKFIPSFHVLRILEYQYGARYSFVYVGINPDVRMFPHPDRNLALAKGAVGSIEQK